MVGTPIKLNSVKESPNEKNYKLEDNHHTESNNKSRVAVKRRSESYSRSRSRSVSHNRSRCVCFTGDYTQ